MALDDCFWTPRTWVFKSMLLYRRWELYLLLPETTKVHATLPTNSMACTVSYKTYINITLDPIMRIGSAAQCVSILFTCIQRIQ